MKGLTRKYIGDLIRKKREEQGWDKTQIAEMCGVTENTIRKIEEGRFDVSIDLVGSIAEVLGVKLTFTED